MNFKFHGKKISGILISLHTHNEVKFEDEMDNYNFSYQKSMKLKIAMGYNKHPNCGKWSFCI